MNSVAELIQRHRGHDTQAWLAGKMNVARSTISNWEKGANLPRWGQLKRLENVLGLVPAQRIEIEDAWHREEESR